LFEDKIALSDFMVCLFMDSVYDKSGLSSYTLGIVSNEFL
jgi:hypothetical protein